MFPRKSSIALVCLLLQSASPVAFSGQKDSHREAIDFFEKRIRPILVEHCYECHSVKASELQGGLNLDNRAAVIRGGESGPVVVPGKPDASRLLQALRHSSDEVSGMPPDKELPDEVVADFERWIRLGLPDPRGGEAPPRVSIQQRAAQHWAFLPPKRPARPVLKNPAWAKTEIDRLALSKLEERGLQPSARAEARTLVRRLYYGLTGLPPNFTQVNEFAQDGGEEPYRKLVDRLLESEQFGERWARHWLDVARFGDTKGYVFTEDRNYPNAYMYRDWVIKSLNNDLPFDRFLMLQIAADRLTPAPSREELAAMGYLTLGRRFLNNPQDIIDDRIDVVFRGMMGLTVGCARCHDHKYDPVLTADYYALYGIFQSSQEKQDKDLPLRLVDKGRASNGRVFLRGNPARPGKVVERGFPSFFNTMPARNPAQGSGRLELAESIVSPQNPLTARVFVNRVWRHLMGEGLVRTPSDFGLRSEPPEQLLILDYLATRLHEHGSIKELIREIVLSKIYQQQSHQRRFAAQEDPENRLLWRANRRRLDFEAMRDSLLAVTAQLDTKVGGPSVRIEGFNPSKRRTLYAFIDRQNLPDLFRTFDFASPDTHSPIRPNTTVPQQALFLLNNRFVMDAADRFVSTLDETETIDRRVETIYRKLLSRSPEEHEVRLARRFIDSNASESSQNRTQAWQRYVHTLLLTNEFSFVD